MTALHGALGAGVAGAFALAALLGAWAWWRAPRGRAFWPVLRTAQGLLAVQAALGGALALTGRGVDDLHLMYGLLALAVSLAAEQLRLSAAQTVLEGRGHESAAAVGELATAQQREVVEAVMRREAGVMAVAAVVIVVLVLRAGV